MQSKFLIATAGAAAFVACCALAGVAGAPRGDQGPDPAEMHKHFVAMCLDGYAHTVGRLAELEVRLGLTEVQKPLFERWKSIVLASAKARATQCAALPEPGAEPSIIDSLKQEEDGLTAELAALKAEEPALQALADALTAEQRETLAHEAVMAFDDEHGGPPPMFGGDPDGPPPPPPDGAPPDHQGPDGGP